MENILSRPVSLDRNAAAWLSVPVFAVLTALGAFIYVPLPFTPVPLTLQVFFVLLSAGLLGRRAAASQGLYLLAGACGLPVFTGALGGLARLGGPTGGYMIGFIAAAYLAGWMLEAKGRSTLRIIFALTAGVAVIHACGVTQLSFVMHISLTQGLLLGSLPFIPGDLLKLTAVIPLVKRKS